MADPLSLLQEFAMGRRELRELQYNGKLYYVFGDVAYQHDARTNLGVYNKQDEYYTIESILLFWRMRELQHTAYVRDVSGRGITSITRVQRRDLLDFLNGGPLPKEANMLAPVPPPIPTAQLKPDKDQQAELDQQQTSSHYEPERKKPKLEQPDKKGQRIDKILDKSIGDSANASATEVRGLSSSLPAEKVAQLRSRVKNNLKNKPLDDESFVSIAEMAPVPNASSDSIGRFIAEKERIRKDRTTCLESHSRDFSTIMAMVKDVHLRENQPKSIAQNQMGAMAGGMTSSMPGSVSQAQQQMKGGQKSMMPVPGGYSRYDQEIFQKEAVADFEIETDLTFHSTGNNALNQQQMNRAAASTRSTAPFTPNGVHARTPDPRQSSLAPVAAPGAGQRQQKRVSRTPIIIIPATGTALITMYNAQDILQDLRFISSDEKKRTYRRENELLLQIPKNGSTVPYRIVDNPTKLKDEEWDRVVAVFVQGPAWQFKGWKWNGNPVEVFANVAAFHLKFEEQKLDSNVAKWSVNVLSLSRTKRHLDRAILQKFWEILDRHIAKSGKREWLRY